jgi:protein-disulfide isomerase
MLRRLSLFLFRRSFVFFLLAVIGCSAQAPSSNLDRRIERQIRSHFNIPASVDIAIGDPKPSSEFPDYKSLSVTFSQGQQQQTQEFLLAKDGNTLVRLTKLDISKDPYSELMKKIDMNGRPTRGAKDAKVTIVNYDDFECPFCARMYSSLLHEVLPSYGDKVKLVMKDFPLTEIHPWAIRAAVNANCLAAQNQDAYWAFSDYVHANQQLVTTGGNASPAAAATRASLQQQQDYLDRLAEEQAQKHQLQMDPLKACLHAQAKTAVQASMREGTELGVEATPTLFVNGEKVDGAVPAAQLRAMIDRALRDAGESVPSQPSQQSTPAAQ